MKSRFVLCFAIVALACSSVAVTAAVKEAKDATCPVSGHGCDPAASAEFDGGTVYFCCEKCARGSGDDGLRKGRQGLQARGKVTRFLPSRPASSASGGSELI